jgi:circadian clock protein KaiC
MAGEAMSDDERALARIPSGIKGLDRVLNGGFVKGGLYIIEGAPGTGKTIFGNQLSFNQAKAGDQVLYVTLIAETVGRMLLNLRNLSFYDDGAIGVGIVYLSGFSALKNGGLTGLLHLLRREVASRRSGILVIDGFAATADSAHSREELKVFVQQLQTQADAVDCTVFLLTNPSEQRPSSEETMVDGIINLSSSVYEWRPSRELYVRKFRGSSYLLGVHSFQIADDGMTVFPRIETLSSSLPVDNGESQRLSTGIPRLDQMLGGGLPCHSVTMLLGPSGTGKTTVGMQFLAESSAAEPGLLVGFYEAPPRIRTRACAVVPRLIQALESGHAQMLWIPPDDHLIDSLADSILDAVRHRNVRRLVIDGLGGFQKAVRSRPIEGFFSAFTYQLRAHKVTTVCTAEVPEIIGPIMTAPLRGLSDATENHIVLRFVEVGASLYRLISILKVRDSNFDSTLREFSITRSGVDIAESCESAEAILSSYSARVRRSDPVKIREN